MGKSSQTCDKGGLIELADLDQCKGITDSLTLKIYKTNTGKVQNSIHLLNIHDKRKTDESKKN